MSLTTVPQTMFYSIEKIRILMLKQMWSLYRLVYPSQEAKACIFNPVFYCILSMTKWSYLRFRHFFSFFRFHYRLWRHKPWWFLDRCLALPPLPSYSSCQGYGCSKKYQVWCCKPENGYCNSKLSFVIFISMQFPGHSSHYVNVIANVSLENSMLYLH